MPDLNFMVEQGK